MIDKKVLKRIFPSERESNNFYLGEKVNGENCITRSFIICTPHNAALVLG
jgi:hypothetical protein